MEQQETVLLKTLPQDGFIKGNREDEQARLLSDEDGDYEVYEGDDDDDDYGSHEEASSNYTCPSMLWRSRTVRYIMLGVFIGISFLLFRITLALVAHKHGHHERPAERLYHNGSDYFASSVIVISLDGFKPDYLDLGVTPHLNRLADQGVKADKMYPIFPTLTFPNHWTLMTGVYAETHGIVANDFYDPQLGKHFQHSNDNISSDDTWWQTVDPLWKTCQDFNRLTASIMWPGSAAIPPTYLFPFNASTTPLQEIDLTLELIDMPYKKRPQFISVYMHHVDSDGHRLGPTDPGMKSSVGKVDQAIGYLMDQLEQRHLEEHVHIVVVSDHGMTTTDKFIYYDDILSPASYSYLRHREGWPLLDLRPHDDAPENATEQIYNDLLTYIKHHPDDAHYQVYLRQDVPEELHYSRHARISPIVTIPETGYAFVTHNTTDPSSSLSHQPTGMHGYDPLNPDMFAIFMAKGPKIDRWFPAITTAAIAPSVSTIKRRKLAPFHNVEIYEFLTELLNINANPNNGTLHGKLVLAD